LAFNKSCSSSYVEQTLLNVQELVWLLAWSNRAPDIESAAIFGRAENIPSP
jgi:hypothetical protein